MKNIRFSITQARRFMLLKQGLLGDYRFDGEQGVYKYIKQAGCIQFDPIDICGKNAELVLQSRVAGFSKDLLYKLLYSDRKLIDYFDKNMSIFCLEDWPCFARQRAKYKEHGRSKEEVDLVADQVKAIIKEKGYVSSRDLKFNQKVNWSWSPTTLSRAVLETLYFRGELVVHHKKGTIKYYGLAEDYIPARVLEAKDPNQTLDEHLEWRVLRRIGAVGLLWNRPSDAWLGIDGLKATNRHQIFAKLLGERKILPITVEGIQHTLFCLNEDGELIDIVLTASDSVNSSQRTEFIAPLDNMLWDRELIRQVFNFKFKWEIYTPADQRQYGYYVLPVLSGDKFIGRIEIEHDKKSKQLIVKHFWFDTNCVKRQRYKSMLDNCLERFAVFNNCEEIMQRGVL